MAEQDSQEAPEPQYATLRERHEASQARARAELLADKREYTNAELAASANRKLKPATSEQELRLRRLMIDALFDPNITIV